MKKQFLKIIGGMILAFLVISIPLLGSALAQDDSKFQAGGGRLEGTWDVQLTIRDCQNGTAIRTIRELATFMSGGTMINSTSSLPQALKTPGHGFWSHENDNTYNYSFKFFRFDSAGAFIGWAIVRHTVTLNARATEYESTGGITFYNTNGDPVPVPPPGCSTATATRFE